MIFLLNIWKLYMIQFRAQNNTLLVLSFNRISNEGSKIIYYKYVRFVLFEVVQFNL